LKALVAASIFAAGPVLNPVETIERDNAFANSAKADFNEMHTHSKLAKLHCGTMPGKALLRQYL